MPEQSDAGSKYINPTAEGYLGVYKLSRYSLEIPFGAWTQYNWRIGDDIRCVPESQGFAIVDTQPADYITTATIRVSSVGPCIRVPPTVVRQTIDIPPHADVRVYEHDSGGMHVVQADPDPMLVTDGGEEVESETDRNYPPEAGIILASREDTEQYQFWTPHDSIFTTAAIDEDQARELAADEYPGRDGSDFQLIEDYCEHDRAMLGSCTICGRSWGEGDV